jgi:beta-lactamase class A
VATQALEILKKPKNDFLSRVLPESVPLASKPGAVERVRCDAGLIYLPRRPYAIAIMSKFAFCSVVEQEQFLADVAQIAYETMCALAASNRFGHEVFSAG